jgi:hypothetical protein
VNTKRVLPASATRSVLDTETAGWWELDYSMLADYLQSLP